MKFSIGDPVFVKSNEEEAVIISFIGKDMACVKTTHAEYHAFLDDLEHPYLRWFLNKENKKKLPNSVAQIIPEKSKPKQPSLPSGFYMGFMPVFIWEGIDESITQVKVYLFNQSEHDIKFQYACIHQGETIFQHQAPVQILEDFYLHDLSFETMSTNPEFVFQFFDKTDPTLYFEHRFTLKPKKFFQFTDQLRYENKPIFHIKLFEELKPRARQEVFVKNTVKPEPRNDNHLFNFEKAKKEVRKVVDLHIEALVQHHHHLSGAEIKNIQLNACQKELELAYALHQHSIVFIHGMGSGRLKNEIHLLFDQTKTISRYVNEYDIRYGYGATEVFFRY